MHSQRWEAGITHAGHQRGRSEHGSELAGILHLLGDRLQEVRCSVAGHHRPSQPALGRKQPVIQGVNGLLASTLACASASRWRAGGCRYAHLHGRGAAAVANRAGPACRHVEDTILTGVPCTLLQSERIPSHGDTKVQIQPRELSLK